MLKWTIFTQNLLKLLKIVQKLKIHRLKGVIDLVIYLILKLHRSLLLVTISYKSGKR
jgi:hypothetical protein